MIANIFFVNNKIGQFILNINLLKMLMAKISGKLSLHKW